MEEAIAIALKEAGAFLSEAISEALALKKLPCALRAKFADDRVVITSRAWEVLKAEQGASSGPPSAPMEGAARDATADVLNFLQRRLQEICRERGL